MPTDSALARVGALLRAPIEQPGRLAGLVKWGLRRPGRFWNMARVKLLEPMDGDRLSYQPYSYDLEPNTVCNFACEMCQTTTWDRKGKNLKPELMSQLLERLPMATELKLQGMGEPMLNKHYFELVRAAADQGVRVLTVSNGSMLGDEKVLDGILECGLSVLSISIDGARKETFEKIRIKGDFDQVTKGIRDLVARRGSHTLPAINVWMVGMKQNIGELVEVVELCHDMGVDALTLQLNLSAWGKEEWEEYLEEQALRDAGDFEDLVAKARTRAAELGLVFSLYHGNDRFSAKAQTKCDWPWRSAYITAEGQVTPCCVVADPAVFSFGSLTEQSFDEIWNGETYRRFRSNMEKGVIPSFCKSCYADCHGVEELDGAGNRELAESERAQSAASVP